MSHHLAQQNSASGVAAPRVLVIAESDPYGASGIQGDLAALAAIGCYGMAVPTALTVQGRRGVRAVHGLPPRVTGAAIRALLDESRVDAVKVGALHDCATARAVTFALKRYRGPLVVDPMTNRAQRRRFTDNGMRDALLGQLTPRATVLTPNMKSAAALCHVDIDSLEMMIAAARGLHDIGANCVMLKGGGLPGDPVDVVVDDDGMALLWGSRHSVPRTRGGGSALSVAVAAALARGAPPRTACIEARVRLDRALAVDHPVGYGTGSLSHCALYMVEPVPG